MATVVRRPDSKYWYAMFRLPMPSADGKLRYRQVMRVTKETVRTKAQKAADQIEEVSLREAGAGDDGSKRILALLTEAGEKAAQKKLTADLGRDFMRRLIELSTGENFKTYTIRAWFGEWMQQKGKTTKPSTLKRYRHATDSFLTYLGDNAEHPLDWITVSHVRTFRDNLHSEGRAAKTVNGYTKDVGAALRAAVREGLILRSPEANLDDLPEDDSVARQPFSLAQVAKLVKCAPSDEWRGVILLGAFGGLRLGDAARLRWDSVDVSERVIRFTPQKSTRKAGGKKIVLPMHEELAEFFLSLDAPDNPQLPCFPSLDKMPIGSRNGLSTAFSVQMKRAGVARAATRTREAGKAGRNTYSQSFHSLRHTFNSLMANGTVSQEMRMKLMGHSEADVNDVYTHLDLAALRAAVQSVPTLPKQ